MDPHNEIRCYSHYVTINLDMQNLIYVQKRMNLYLMIKKTDDLLALTEYQMKIKIHLQINIKEEGHDFSSI